MNNRRRIIGIGLAIAAGAYVLYGATQSGAERVGNQLILGVLLSGSVYALFGFGLTITYKASRVPNFAHGVIGTVGAFAFFKFWDASGIPPQYRYLEIGLPFIKASHVQWTPPRLPLIAALLIGITSAALLSYAVERFVMRQFSESSMINKIVASIGLLLVIQGLALDFFNPQTSNVTHLVPCKPCTSFVLFDTFGIPKEGLLYLVVAIVLGLGIGAFFKYSTLGIAIRSVADSREVSRLLGVNANRVASVSWAIAGALAGIAGILITPQQQLDALALTAFIVKGFTAALFGGFTSLGGTLAGGLFLGAAEAVIPALNVWPLSRLGSQQGSGSFVALIVILILMLWKPKFAFRNLRVEEDSGVGLARTRSGIAPEDRQRRDLAKAGLLVPLLRDWRVARVLLGATIVGLVLAYPQINTKDYWNFVLGLGVVFALVSLSVVVVTGWTGQISLAQITFFGGGALMAGYLSGSGWKFWFYIPVAGLFGAALAVIVGLPALRLKGFFLALATLSFAFAGQDWMYNLTIWKNRLRADPAPLTNKAASLYVLMLVAALLFFFTWQLRKTRTARAFLAIRDSERTAQAMGINPVRYKLTAFALSGFIGGAAGACSAMLSVTFSLQSFLALFSIQYLANTVVAGVSVLPAAVFVGVSFGVLPQVFQTPATGINNVPVILAGFFAILTVLQNPQGAVGSLIRLVRPFNRKLEFEAWNREAANESPTEEDEHAAEALKKAALGSRDPIAQPAFAPGGGGA